MDSSLAHEAGELCGRARTSDVVDAAVALVANRFGDDVVTGDPGDLQHLLDLLLTRSKIRDLRTL
jgi:hypothetical protein